MKSHIWRPLYVALLIVAAVLLARVFIVPSDFGVGEQGYMYGWHRKSSEDDWKAVQVKYTGAQSCEPCHIEHFRDLKESPHKNINCENCHGPLMDHPRDRLSIRIDRSRGLCLRCHAKLPYNGSQRSSIRGINPETHYTSAECVMCHYPHNPYYVYQEPEVAK